MNGRIARFAWGTNLKPRGKAQFADEVSNRAIHSLVSVRNLFAVHARDEEENEGDDGDE